MRRVPHGAARPSPPFPTASALPNDQVAPGAPEFQRFYSQNSNDSENDPTLAFVASVVIPARQRRHCVQHLRSSQRWLVVPPLAPQPQGVIVVMMICIHQPRRQPHTIMFHLKRNRAIYCEVSLVVLRG